MKEHVENIHFLHPLHRRSLGSNIPPSLGSTGLTGNGFGQSDLSGMIRHHPTTDGFSSLRNWRNQCICRFSRSFRGVAEVNTTVFHETRNTDIRSPWRGDSASCLANTSSWWMYVDVVDRFKATEDSFDNKTVGQLALGLQICIGIWGSTCHFHFKLSVKSC